MDANNVSALFRQVAAQRNVFTDRNWLFVQNPSKRRCNPKFQTFTLNERKAAVGVFFIELRIPGLLFAVDVLSDSRLNFGMRLHSPPCIFSICLSEISPRLCARFAAFDRLRGFSRTGLPRNSTLALFGEVLVSDISAFG